MDEQQFKGRIEKIHSQLKLYSYYQLLNLQEDADVGQIRSQFHRMALSMHPDRFTTHPDADLRKKVYAVYKGVTEAYRVLMNPEHRREYDEALQRGEKQVGRKKRKVSMMVRPEQALTNAQAKKFYRLATDAERRGDSKSARINYKFAMDLEGEHPMLLERLAALEVGGEK